MLENYIPVWMRGVPEHEVSPDAITKLGKHALRQTIAKVSADKFEDLPNRIAAFRMLSERTPAEPENPALVPGKQNRPEINAMGRWAPRDYSQDREATGAKTGFDQAVEQANFLIHRAMHPESFEEWRRRVAGISTQQPNTIAW